MLALRQLFGKKKKPEEKRHVDLCPKDCFYSIDVNAKKNGLDTNEYNGLSRQNFGQLDYYHMFALFETPETCYYLDLFKTSPENEKMKIERRLYISKQKHDFMFYNSAIIDYFCFIYVNKFTEKSKLQIYTGFTDKSKNILTSETSIVRKNGEYFREFLKHKRYTDQENIDLLNILMARCKHVNRIEFDEFDGRITTITSCKSSGNFAFSISKQFFVYQMQLIKIHLDKTKFTIDFLKIHHGETEFIPTSLCLCYNYLACISDRYCKVLYLDFLKKNHDANKCITFIDSSTKPKWPTTIESNFHTLLDLHCSPTELSYGNDNDQQDEKIFHKVVMVPIFDEHNNVRSVVLYVAFYEEIVCSIAHFNVDNHKFLPISRLLIPPGVGLKDFSVSIDKDMIHVLGRKSLTTYVSHVHSCFLNYFHKDTNKIELKNNFKRMYMVETVPILDASKFTNIISTKYLITLIHVDGSIYNIKKPNYMDLQKNLLNLINSFKSKSRFYRRIFYRKAKRPAYFAISTKKNSDIEDRQLLINSNDDEYNEQGEVNVTGTSEKKWQIFFDKEQSSWNFLRYCENHETSDQLSLSKRKSQIYEYCINWKHFHSYYKIL